MLFSYFYVEMIVLKFEIKIWFYIFLSSASERCGDYTLLFPIQGLKHSEQKGLKTQVVQKNSDLHRAVHDLSEFSKLAY